MSQSKLTRRGFAVAAATGVAAMGLLGASAKSADAYQGNMEHALSALNQALASLRESTANKGGHRGRAMELVRQAIDETQAGIEFAEPVLIEPTFYLTCCLIWSNEVPLTLAAGHVKTLLVDFMKVHIHTTKRPGASWLD